MAAHSFILSEFPWNFGTVVLLSFAVMLVQYGQPWFETVPIFNQWNRVDYEYGPPTNDLRHDYTNMSCEKTNTGDALCVLAEGAGLGTLLQIGLLYPQAKEQYVRQLAIEKGEFEPYISLDYLKNSLSHYIWRYGGSQIQ